MIASIVAGVMLGLSVALPFGPVSFVCVQRSIASGFRQGVASGAGAASAQGIFAGVALAGRSVVPAELVGWSGPVRWFAAALLLLLGLRTLTRRRLPGESAVHGGILAAYGSSLLLALSNPMTILPYLAMASGTAAASTHDQAFSPWSIPGVMTGAVLWYGFLSGAAWLFRAGLAGRLVRHLNLVAGSMLLVLGIWVALG